MEKQIHEQLSRELADSDPPPLGNLVADAAAAGRRLRRRQHLATVGSGVAVLVVVASVGTFAAANAGSSAPAGITPVGSTVAPGSTPIGPVPSAEANHPAPPKRTPAPLPTSPPVVPPRSTPAPPLSMIGPVTTPPPAPKSPPVVIVFGH
jgi:hypothetical protein